MSNLKRRGTSSRHASAYRADALHLARRNPALLKQLAGPTLAEPAYAAMNPAPRVISLSLRWPPPLNRLYRTYRGRVLLSADGRAYKTGAALLAIRSKPLDGPVAVTLHLYRPRKAGDIDGPLKLALDVLQGVAYANDSQIVALRVFRHEDKKRPRIEVAVMDAATDYRDEWTGPAAQRDGYRMKAQEATP